MDKFTDTESETPPWQEQPESPDDPTPAGILTADMGRKTMRVTTTNTARIMAEINSSLV